MIGTLPACLSLGVASFHEPLKSQAMSTEQFVDTAAALGFVDVELCDRTVPEDGWPAVAGLLRRRGVAMTSLAIRNDFTEPGEGGAAVEHVARWIEIAAGLGCRVVRVWTGTGRADLTAARRVRAAFAALAPVARRHAVHMALETHGGLSNDPAFVAGLVDAIGLDALGVCVDFGNLPRPDHERLVRVLAPITTHVHVKSYEFDEHGVERTVRLESSIRALLRAGFSGQWVIEYEGEPPYDAGVTRTVAATLRALS